MAINHIANECENMPKKSKLDHEKFQLLIREYTEGKKKMGEIAEEIGMTKSNLSFYFNNKLIPNPVRVRKEFLKHVYDESSKHIENGLPCEILIEKYPCLESIQKIKRLKNQGKIHSKKKVLSGKQIVKAEKEKMIIDDFRSGIKTAEILAKHKIERGLFTSILRKEYGVTSISKAKVKVNEKN